MSRRTTSPTTIASRPAAPDPLEDAGIGLALADDLRHIRGAIVQAELAGNFAASFDLATFQIAREVLAIGYRIDPLSIRVVPAPLRPNGRAAAWSPGERTIQTRRTDLATDWLDIDDDGEAFAAFRKLPEKAKRALFAFCVARTLAPRLSLDNETPPEYEATVERLGIDFAAHVRPTADGFFSRIPKARMHRIARQVLGGHWAGPRRTLKKQPLAREMETAFAAGDAIPSDLTAETRAAALAWLPPGFRPFGAGDAPANDAPGGAAEDTGETGGEGVATAPVPAGEAPSGDAGQPVAESPPAEAEAHPSDTPHPSATGAIDALNSLPTADGSPRLVVIDIGGPPRTGSGDANTTPAENSDAATAEAADDEEDTNPLPAFLRRTA